MRQPVLWGGMRELVKFLKGSMKKTVDLTKEYPKGIKLVFNSLANFVKLSRKPLSYVVNCTCVFCSLDR